MSIWDYSKGPAWKRSRESQKLTVETLELWEGAALDEAKMPKPYVCVAFIPDDVRGKRTSSESVLNRLRRANRGLLMQEWKILHCEESGPGHTWTFSIEEASVKALEKLDFKPYFNFGRVQFRLKANYSAETLQTGDETGPSTSRIKPAGGGTTTSSDKGSGGAPNRGRKTALKGISTTLKKEGPQLTRRTQEGRLSPRSETVAGSHQFASGARGEDPTGREVTELWFAIWGRKDRLRIGRQRVRTTQMGRNVCSWAERRGLRLLEGGDSGSRPRSRDSESNRERENPDLGLGRGAPVPVGELGDLVSGRGAGRSEGHSVSGKFHSSSKRRRSTSRGHMERSAPCPESGSRAGGGASASGSRDGRSSFRAGSGGYGSRNRRDRGKTSPP
ncbi:hypothetical protein JTB14_034743 [Gonioctena quinquepunctata]|nr:hypothetical protein JTB14_034743 [Gonioctena quinquepunctata]